MDIPLIAEYTLEPAGTVREQLQVLLYLIIGILFHANQQELHQAAVQVMCSIAHCRSSSLRTALRGGLFAVWSKVRYEGSVFLLPRL